MASINCLVHSGGSLFSNSLGNALLRFYFVEPKCLWVSLSHLRIVDSDLFAALAIFEIDCPESKQRRAANLLQIALKSRMTTVLFFCSSQGQ